MFGICICKIYFIEDLILNNLIKVKKKIIYCLKVVMVFFIFLFVFVNK